MSDITKQNTAVLAGGGVEYSMEEAVLPIDELIAALEEMKEDGMEYVVQSSGNYRGAQWARVSADWSFADDE